MNKENLLKTADAIENGIPNVVFNMRHFKTLTHNSSITQACVIGYVAIINNFYNGDDLQEKIMKWLDMSYEEYTNLALPHDFDLEKITKENAIDLLRYAAEVNVVDWSYVGLVSESNSLNP